VKNPQANYIENLINYVNELLNRNFLVFAIKGICREDDSDFRECKQPVNIPKKFKYEHGYSIDFKRSVTLDTIRKLKFRHAYAIAIPGEPNDILWLDIEYRVVREFGGFLQFIKKFKFDLDEVYIESTPRGGIHIAFRLDIDFDFTGIKGWIDNKRFGYVVSAPSKIFPGSKVLEYNQLSSCNVWETANISRYRHRVENLLKTILELKRKYESIEGDEGKVIVYTIPRILNVVTFREVNEKIREIVSKLPIEIALIYAQCIFNRIGCGECTRYFITQLINNEPIEMCNTTYPTNVQRGLHTIFEIELFGALKLLGFSDDQLWEICERIKYTCNGKEYNIETPPERNLKYNIFKGIYSIAFKGLCPFKLGNEIANRFRIDCPNSLVYKLNVFIQSNEYEVFQILKNLLMKLNEGVLSD